MIILGVSSMSAMADPADPVAPYASYTETYNSNLLSLANSADAIKTIGSPNLSDVYRTEIVGLAIDDIFGLQHITADINDTAVQFRRFSTMNYEAPAARGNWKWDIQDTLTGNFGASYVKSLTPSLYFHLPEKNLQVVKMANFDIAWLFHPSWRATASVDAFELIFDLPVQQPYMRNAYQSLLGIDYLTADASSVGLQVGKLRTYFPNPEQFGTELIANNSSQDEFKAKIEWNFSAKTQLEFLGGWVHRKYEVLKTEDYSGWNERLGMTWLPSSKLNLKAQAWREITAVDGLSTSYSIDQGGSFNTIWKPTEKISLEEQLTVEKHSLAETLSIISGAPVPGISYTSRTGMLILTYAPTLNWKFITSASYTAQSATTISNDFSGYAVNGTIAYQF